MSDQSVTISSEEAIQALSVAAESERSAHQTQIMPRWITVSIVALTAAVIAIFAIPDSAKSWRLTIFAIIAFLESIVLVAWTSRNRGIRFRKMIWSKARLVAGLPCLIIWVAAFWSALHLAGTGWVLLIALGTFLATTAIILAADAYGAKHAGVATQ